MKFYQQIIHLRNDQHTVTALEACLEIVIVPVKRYRFPLRYSVSRDS